MIQHSYRPPLVLNPVDAALLRLHCDRKVCSADAELVLRGYLMLSLAETRACALGLRNLARICRRVLNEGKKREAAVRPPQRRRKGRGASGEWTQSLAHLQMRIVGMGFKERNAFRRARQGR